MELVMHTNLLKERQIHGVRNEPLNTNLTTSHDHDKSIKNIILASEESITSEKYSTPEKYVKYASAYLIQTKLLSIPHTTIMLETNVTVVYDSQYFVALRKNNHIDTAPRSQVELRYDIPQCKNNNTTHTICQKHPLPGKEYLCF